MISHLNADYHDLLTFERGMQPKEGVSFPDQSSRNKTTNTVKAILPQKPCQRSLKKTDLKIGAFGFALSKIAMCQDDNDNKCGVFYHLMDRCFAGKLSSAPAALHARGLLLWQTPAPGSAGNECSPSIKGFLLSVWSGFKLRWVIEAPQTGQSRMSHPFRWGSQLLLNAGAFMETLLMTTDALKRMSVSV